MSYWTRLPLSLISLVLGACGDPPGEVVTSADGSSGTTGDVSTMPPPTTMPSEDTTQGTQGGTGIDTTVGVVDTTSDPSTTAPGTTSLDPTTSGSSSGAPLECPPSCPNNQTCIAGTDECVSVCDTWGDGHYGYCLTELGGFDSVTLCGAPMSCINSGGMNGIEVVVCGRTCTTLCDCPAPPEADGDATVTCGDLVVGGSNECYLSCAGGETCPNGMTCRNAANGLMYCTHPVQPLAMYGNCDDIAAPCLDGTCAVSGSYSVCVSLCLGGIGDCDPAPPGATMGVACGTVISPPDGSDCYLPCAVTNDCPPGMECVNDTGDLLCMWP